MNKLETIDNFLKSRDDIFVINPEPVVTIDIYEYFTQTQKTTYWIAPKTSLFKACELNDFILTLLPPGIEHYGLVPSRSFNECTHGLDCGYLSFSEVIGSEKIRRTVVLNEDIMKNKFGYKSGKKTYYNSKELDRHIYLRLFPCELIVKDLMAKYKGGYPSKKEILNFIREDTIFYDALEYYRQMDNNKKSI